MKYFSFLELPDVPNIKIKHTLESGEKIMEAIYSCIHIHKLNALM